MNSLTANNRLSQQLVVSVAAHLLLRHECRLPNHLAVSNHRELYLTVGGELCRNLTAGFVTEEDFMFMLFVGSQKHSALSIFAKTTRMSALVLCGNSGVILLSVKDHQHIDSAIPGRYTVQAPYKTGAGIGVLKLITEHNRAHAVFSCHEHYYAQIMVGRTGPTSVGPGSVVSGNANPVRLTTSVIGVPCGEFSKKLTTGAVTMTTLPTLSQPEIAIVDGQAVTSSLAVADFFSKRHDDVLKKIRILDCSPEFCARNFAETSILVRQPNGGTRKLPCYQITRDGFAFLAMGFTGKRAARFKEAYINAFNQMEKQLSKPSTLSDAAHNASVLYSHLSVIHKVWLQQLYPMLAKVESPLAISLYDHINDAAAISSLINMT
ncbi:Rha family transcriptional regulator, partial [Escherichia coli]|nr:peptidase [Escherichia coli]EES7022880.1 peptidase [Escherichia coli]EEY9479530.1 peptidase [Escherichia coli]EHK1523551.1 Rha family transcriptional regulator [Escherichia coli]